VSNRKFAMAVAASMVVVGPAQALARTAGPVPPLQAAVTGELVVPVHCVPIKGSKGGGTCGNHKQCLYGVYGSQGQYKGLHYHLNAWHRGSACGSAARDPGAIQFSNEPKFRPKRPPRLVPPSGRR
jgi:hypothetical protein